MKTIEELDAEIKKLQNEKVALVAAKRAESTRSRYEYFKQLYEPLIESGEQCVLAREFGLQSDYFIGVIHDFTVTDIQFSGLHFAKDIKQVTFQGITKEPVWMAIATLYLIDTLPDDLKQYIEELQKQLNSISTR